MDVKISNKQADLRIAFVTKKQTKKNKVLKRLGDSFNYHLINDTVYVNIKDVKSKDDHRELGFGLVDYLNKLNAKTAMIDEDDIPSHAGPFIEGLLLGDYKFDVYKSTPKKNTLKYIYFNVGTAFKPIMKEAMIRAESQNFVREMVNIPPGRLTTSTLPPYINSFARHVVDDPDTQFKVSYYRETDLEAFNMDGHLAVNKASPHPAMTVKIEHTPEDWDKHIVLVGKGLTYDSGGLDIKTGGHMQNMKSDKGGAMTVLGIMRGLAELGSKHKVTAYMAMAENMIDGEAYKADDVLIMKNGTSVHVKNTDAEGRIVLFDNLCLAEEENPDFDEIYTFATLTGAAVYQFGDEACGMVGFNDKMKKKIKKVGDVEGEVFCNAEFHKFMMNGVDDKVADISNTGTKNQGCQKAGLFLTHALSKKGKKKYLHLDIAGPAFAASAWGTNKAGGTGFAVRTFLNYLTR